MANCRLSMRKITEALRLHHESNRPHREIARAIGASPTTVGQYLRRAREAGIGYPLPADLDEAALECKRPTRPRLLTKRFWVELQRGAATGNRSGY